VNANIDREQFPEEIRKQSTSLQEILGKQISKIRFARLVLENFEKYYDLLQRNQFTPILKEWKLNTDTLGRNITVLSAGQTISGEAVDITSEGALVIKKGDGETVSILSGTVQ